MGGGKLKRRPSPAKDVKYSGKLVVRMPLGLHASLASEARDEGVSLNLLIVSKLSLTLGRTIG